MKPSQDGGGGRMVFYSFDTLYTSYARVMAAWQPGGSGVCRSGGCTSVIV